MAEKFSRRNFVKLIAALIGAAGLGVPHFLKRWIRTGGAQQVDTENFLPLVRHDHGTAPTATSRPTDIPDPSPMPPHTPGPIPTSSPPPELAGRVVHVHAPGATNWNGEPYYWNYVNQDVVNEMVDQGLMELTGKTTVEEAWQFLLPDYEPGQGIAVKVNFNNATECDDMDSQIDAIIQPVNALVRSMKLRGVSEQDIWIYDAIRALPDRFMNGNLYSGVRFYDNKCNIKAGWSSSDPDAFITFSPPADIPLPPPIRLTDVIIDAAYLINMPIMKLHSFTGWSLSFKHHFGTINHPYYLHKYTSLNGDYFSPTYSPFIDIYKNPHILNKTILTIGDGIFSAFGIGSPPSPWNTFNNNVPNSLFLSTDPVAIDCVMGDLLSAEREVDIRSDYYLILANNADLGIFERGDPWGNNYNLIDYSKYIL
jgi:hypothetical protein